MSQLAVYAGSFDPPTNGHVWMIERGAALFQNLIVAIGVNPAKKAAYPLPKRLAWLNVICGSFSNVRVAEFGNLFLAEYARQVGAGFILRGIRSEPDFAYEQTMRHINGDINHSLETVFLIPPREISEVSSSLVRGVIGPQGWRTVVQKYVPECVYADLDGAHA